jgi:lysophospholipase L1-like esterase
MQFRTELHIPPVPDVLSLNAQVLTLGSCFADVMGSRLAGNKFRVLVNPFGVIFNPVSLAKVLASTSGPESLNSGIVERDGRWYHYDLHSQWSAASPEEMDRQTQELLVPVRRFFQQTDVIILTLGTAYVYRLQRTGELVANCHKMPAAHFKKELLSPGQVTEALHNVFTQVHHQRPSVRIILTVSPVRHLKDGIAENQVSKSILRVACHELVNQFPFVHYFPSYELMMDDLRDYRFYKPDMIHPSELAEEYIWQKLTEVYLTAAERSILADWEKIQRALAHKPFHPESAGHRQFLRKLLERLRGINPVLDVGPEIARLEAQLNEYDQ